MKNSKINQVLKNEVLVLYRTQTWWNLVTPNPCDAMWYYERAGTGNIRQPGTPRNEGASST
jgi:hypothetical protein